MNAKRALWMALAYVLPAVGAAAVAFLWFIYCVLTPNRQVDSLVMGGEPPADVVYGPWEADAATGGERRKGYLDRTFLYYTLLEHRDGQSWTVARGDAKLARIASATIAGILVYLVAWNLWIRMLRRARRRL